jgi:histidine triad (HIT) family protein
MTDCIFCKIISGAAPAKRVYEDDRVIAFHDRHPAAPVHILIVPIRHIASVNDLTDNDEALMGHLFTVARLIAQQEGIAETGYRLVVNTGHDGGQAVFHLHMHLLGGQRVRGLAG